MHSTPIELTYKEVDGLQIKLDVYIPSTATSQNRAPAMLWWHGGGLLMLSKDDLFHHLRAAVEKYKICLISANYRLAPQTRFPSILEDCKDSMDFLYTPEFAKATDNRVNLSNLIVSGGSAGGWLALLCGTGIGFEASGLSPPRPVKGIVAIYPITDLQHPFWKTKQRPGNFLGHIIPDEDMVEFFNPNGPKRCETPADFSAPINMMYFYMVQEYVQDYHHMEYIPRFLIEVVRAILESSLLDGTSVPAEAYSIAPNLRTKKFRSPPTFITHGNGDRLVPVDQSRDVVQAFKDIEADIIYEEPEGLDHIYDMDSKYEMENMYTFILKCFSD